MIDAMNHDLEILKTILQQFPDPIVVCDRDATIVLVNMEAVDLFQRYIPLAPEPGRSMFDFCSRKSIEHVLDMLQPDISNRVNPSRNRSDIRFICGFVQTDKSFHCHCRAVTFQSLQQTLFVFTFAHDQVPAATTERISVTVREWTNIFRPHLANLVSAVETLQGNPQMAANDRVDFENIIAGETGSMVRLFTSLTDEFENVVSKKQSVTDIFSADLIGRLIRTLNPEAGINIIMSGASLWLQADPWSLMQVMEWCVCFLHERDNASTVEVETLLGDKRVSLDLVWQGTPLSSSELERIRQAVPGREESSVTIGEILDRHDSEMWSLAHSRPGHALLRIPVPISSRQWQPDVISKPNRDILYDFSSLTTAESDQERNNRSLSSLSFVAFDTETTGLQPKWGDEIVAISAVRIRESEILNSERFECLVRPGRLVRKDIFSLLSIDADSLHEADSAESVLQKFLDFVGDSVLVGHNTNFDLAFFQDIAQRIGIEFSCPVLDTMILGSLAGLEGDFMTLKAIGEKLGVAPDAVSVASQDCDLIADIFLRLLNPLAEKGLTSLSSVLAGSGNVIQHSRERSDKHLK